MAADLIEPPLSGAGEQDVRRPAAGIPRADLLISLAILLATFAAYCSVVRFGFLSGLDDPLYVVHNPHLRDGLTRQNLNWIFFSLSPDYWFPVTRLSLLADYNLFALQAGGYHAENVVIHALATVLLFGFLRRATGVRWPSAFVALVFALHPLHVESVAWVSERKDVLCAFFWFASLWAWLRYAERPTAGRYAAALVWFSLGLMSKPMIVTLPLLLLLMDFWPLRRRFSPRLLVEKIPFAVLACAVMKVTVAAQRAAGALMQTPPSGLRVENALISVAAYIAHTVWPVRLAVLYPYPQSLPIWQAFAAASGILAVSAVVLRERHTRPYLAAGWFWFLLTLAPVLGLVQAGLQARTDHYMYVPMVGLSVMLAWGAADLVAWRPSTRKLAAGLGAAACLSMAVLTTIQTQYWRSAEELFQHAINLDAGNYLAWDYLGQTLAGGGGLPSEAISCFRNALRIRPDFAETHNNLAVVLGNSGRREEEIAEYREAIQLNPDLTPAHYNFAVTLREGGQNQEAINQFETTLWLNPSSADSHRDLGILLASTGHLYEGIAHLEQAVHIEPDDLPAQFNLGRALYLSGHYSESIIHLTEALRMDPQFVAAHLSLADALVRVPGRRQDAIAHLEAAERIHPNPKLQKQLDQLKADVGDGRH